MGSPEHELSRMNQVNDDKSSFEEPEGVDDPFQAGWGDYPLDAVFVRTEPRTVGDVVDRIDRQRYILDPDFQRDFVWQVPKQSKLIESCIMRIPLPVFYVAEAPDGRIIVVDGLQRLTTFHRFIHNQFRLTGLGPSDAGAKHPLEGRFFKELSVTLQERVADTPLTMYILDAKAPERARLDIFERVNSGEPLTRQQMRNALYNGPATAWLKEAAASPIFRKATGGSLNALTMRDREAINRFCAFKLLKPNSYRGDMDTFLAQGLSVLTSRSDAERKELRAQFDDAMTINAALFGEHAFRKSLAYGSSSTRSVLNISLFEVCAVAMAGVGPLKEVQKANLREAIIAVLGEAAFTNAITYSTNSTSQVRTRFDAMDKVVNEMLGAQK
jgi:hypothetical protein